MVDSEEKLCDERLLWVVILLELFEDALASLNDLNLSLDAPLVRWRPQTAVDLIAILVEDAKELSLVLVHIEIVYQDLLQVL